MGNGEKFSKLEIIRDPIYGYIELEEGVEIKEKTTNKPGLIDLPCFQRLRFVSQTPGVYYVYPGGFTSRFMHSIGTCYLAGEICKNLKELDERLDESECKKVRLAALLHDIGHGPFSHVFDDFLESIGDGRTHEKLGREIIKLPEIEEIIEGMGESFGIDEVSEIAWGVEKDKKAKSPFCSFERGIISGYFDVDKLDYLVRDSYFAGVEYGNIDVYRIIKNLKIFENKIALDQRAKLALEQMFIQRELMFKAVYFHRTVRAWEVQLLLVLNALEYKLRLKEMLDKALKDDGSTESLFELQENYILTKLFEIYNKKEVSDPTLRRHLRAVLFRDPKHLFRSVAEERVIQAPPDSRKIRDAVCEDIATKVNQKTGTNEMTKDCIFIDTPSLTKKPSEIRPDEPFPLVDVDKPYHLPEDSWINKIKPRIEFTRFFTFPEYVSKCKDAIEEIYPKEKEQASNY